MFFNCCCKGKKESLDRGKKNRPDPDSDNPDSPDGSETEASFEVVQSKKSIASRCFATLFPCCSSTAAAREEVAEIEEVPVYSEAVAEAAYSYA